MNWEKIGNVFKPTGNPDWMQTHCAVAFSEPLDGALHRIYFTTRDKQNRSHIGSFDLDLNAPTKAFNISPTPVLAPGPLGSFDDSGAMMSWLVKDGDRKILYFQGWNLGVTVPFYNSIGIAVSDGDGEFHKISRAPSLGRDEVDPFFCGNPCVLKDGAVWRMWYLSCERWEQVDGQPKHYYHLKYAESTDGIDWKKSGIASIDFKSDEEYAIARPCVIKENDTYKMWYCYRGDRYRIGYAESKDGIHFDRKDELVGLDTTEGEWDSDMVEYPHVFDYDGRRYMLYNGNDYGKSGVGLAVLSNK